MVQPHLTMSDSDNLIWKKMILRQKKSGGEITPNPSLQEFKALFKTFILKHFPQNEKTRRRGKIQYGDTENVPKSFPIVCNIGQNNNDLIKTN